MASGRPRWVLSEAHGGGGKACTKKRRSRLARGCRPIAVTGPKDEARKPGVPRIASAGRFPVSPLGRVAPFVMLIPVCTVAGGAGHRLRAERRFMAGLMGEREDFGEP